jgi:hypothetical protein
MARSNLDTVRAYYAASERNDDEVAAKCIASVPGFVWADHQKGVVCRTGVRASLPNRASSGHGPSGSTRP